MTSSSNYSDSTEISKLSGMDGDENNEIETFYCSTRIEMKKFLCTWEIENISDCYVEIGVPIKSPTFTLVIGNSVLDFIILLYPNGASKEYKDFVCFDVLHTSGVPSKELFLQLSIARSYEKDKQIFGRFYNFSGMDDTEKQMCKRNSLDNYLSNGNLIIQCKIYHFINSESSELKIQKSIDELSSLSRRLMELDVFERLLENKISSDIEFILDNNQSIPSHKCILIARSSVFETMFKNPTQVNENNKVRIKDVEYDVMKELLRFIYSGKVKNIEAMADKLYIVADRYKLHGLKFMCENVLISQLSNETICMILSLIDHIKSDKILSAVTDFLIIHGKELTLVNKEFNENIGKLSSSLLAVVTKALMKRF